jgi:hypothetical protein
MIHGLWLICLVTAALLGLAAYRPGIGLFLLRTQRKWSPLAVRTLFVGMTGLALGAAAYSFAEPHGSATGVGLAACAVSLGLLLPWTAIILAPRRQGISPWVFIGKAFVWGPALGAAFGGACAVLDHEAVGPLVAGAAIVGFVMGPWGAAMAWADKLGVFRRRRKVQGAVDSSPHDAGVDPE